jgi:hypothetical protein
MFGKPEWFQRRKYLGWGLAPRTWQGWVYILVLAIPLIIIPLVPGPDAWKVPALIVWAGLFAIDLIRLMIILKKDERETQHEAIAERNAAWVMITIVAVGVAYQAAQQARGGPSIDPFLFAVMIGGLLAKMITNVYLEHKA